MKKLLLIIYLIIYIFAGNISLADTEVKNDRKAEILALYNSNNIEAASKLIFSINEKERDYEHWYLLANIMQDQKKEENAILFLKKSIFLKPDFDKAHYNLANIYLNQKRYNNAIYEYKLAIKYKKDFPYYYYNLGCTYLAQKDYDEAKDVLKKAIELKNDEPSFYYNLAFAYKGLKKNKDAEKALEMYNKLNKKEDL